MKSISALLATALACMLAIVPGVEASEPTVLKLHSSIAQTRPEAREVERFASLVDEKSGGGLKIEVYHSGSLGLKETDMMRIMKAGLVDMAFLYGEYYNRDAPALPAIYAQGAITKGSQHLEVLPTLRKLYSEAYGKWGIHSVGGVVAPVFDVGLHCKEPVNSLEQLKDKKVRVWSSHLVDTFKHLGITAQVIPQNDMYLALQTGVVDCAYYLSTVAKTVSLQEVTDYEAYLHPWAASPWIFGVSDKTWQRLDEDQRRVLQEAGEEVWAATRDRAVDPERERLAREERQALGIEILPAFSAADVKTFVSAANKAWEEMAERAGPEGLGYYHTVSSLTRH